MSADTPADRPAAERVARQFHETYERLAPGFGWLTRPSTNVPWDDVPEANRGLMIATCREVLAELVSELAGMREKRDEWERAHQSLAADHYFRRAEIAEAECERLRAVTVTQQETLERISRGIDAERMRDIAIDAIRDTE